MGQERTLPPGYTVWYPNREKASAKVVKWIVVVVLLVTIALMLAITFGGWGQLEGMKPVNFAWCIIFAICAWFIARWARGALPIAAGFGVLLLMLAIVAGLGLAYTTWYGRNHAGFLPAMSIFGGKGLPNSVLGTLTVILIPVQIVLIVFALQGFSQGWNIEEEIHEDELERRRSGKSSSEEQESAAA